MKTVFDKPMSDEWTSRALAHAIYGGADFGECTTTAGRIVMGDADSWYREWNVTADRVSAIGEASEAKGHKRHVIFDGVARGAEGDRAAAARTAPGTLTR